MCIMLRLAGKRLCRLLVVIVVILVPAAPQEDTTTSDYMAQNMTTGVEMGMNASDSISTTMLSVIDDSDDDSDHPLYYISEMIFLIIIPFITVLGVITNSLMLVVMQRPSLKKTPVSVYISALAVSDSLVLLFDFINNWLHFVSGYHLKSSSVEFCRFYNWIFHTLFTYSAWLVVAVAVERFIVVWMPLRARQICTIKKAIITVSVMPVVIGILQSYNFVIWELNAEREGRCDTSPLYDYFTSNVYSWYNNVVYCYIPVLILILANVGIVVNIASANKKRRELTGNEDNKETRKITITIVLICLMFILLTTPLTLFYAIIYSSDQFVTQSPSMALGRQLVLILALSNYTINFFLYVLTSANFRSELRAMFGGSLAGKMMRSNTSTADSNKEMASVPATGVTGVSESETSEAPPAELTKI